MEHARHATRGWRHAGMAETSVRTGPGRLDHVSRLATGRCSRGSRRRLAGGAGLVTATTDSRSMTRISDDIYRFQAIVASMREFQMIHGTDERLTLDNLRRLTEFYSRLVASAAG